jgi:hypothetical protein
MAGAIELVGKKKKNEREEEKRREEYKNLGQLIKYFV